MGMGVFMFVLVCEMDVKLRAGNGSSFLPRHVQMIFVQTKFLQLMLERVRIHAEIQHRADEHVTADAAEDVEVKSFHE
jgi:hypothetical protein